MQCAVTNDLARMLKEEQANEWVADWIENRRGELMIEFAELTRERLAYEVENRYYLDIDDLGSNASLIDIVNAVDLTEELDKHIKNSEGLEVVRTSKYIAGRAKDKPYLFKIGNNWVLVDSFFSVFGRSCVAIRKTPLEAYNATDVDHIPNDIISQYLSSFGV